MKPKPPAKRLKTDKALEKDIYIIQRRPFFKTLSTEKPIAPFIQLNVDDN
ncbi:MAG: hypothetical protein JRF39_05635 [Deltaproteobacteria bacterium]|nr:hypothetical protein [Deltaproteobacteria bacterium]